MGSTIEKLELTKITKKRFKELHKGSKLKPLFTKWKTLDEVVRLLESATQEHIDSLKGFIAGRNDVDSVGSKLTVEVFEAGQFIFCVKHYHSNDSCVVITYQIIVNATKQLTAYQTAKKILDDEGLEALYNPHASTGEYCGCHKCFCCVALKVLKKYVSKRQQFLASQGIFDDVDRIEVHGIRWKEGPNTYHIARITLRTADGKSKQYKTKKAYGYERQYEDTAYQYIFVDTFNNSDAECFLSRLCEANGIEYSVSHKDVEFKDRPKPN